MARHDSMNGDDYVRNRAHGDACDCMDCVAASNWGPENPEHACDPKPFGDGEWARCGIGGDDTFPVTYDAGYGLPPGSFKIVRTQQDIAELLHVLRRVWDGADRGELMALLREAWGPSPATMKRPDADFSRIDCPRDGCGATIGNPCGRWDNGTIWSHSERLRPSPAIVQPSDLRGLAARESQR